MRFPTLLISLTFFPKVASIGGSNVRSRKGALMRTCSSVFAADPPLERFNVNGDVRKLGHRWKAKLVLIGCGRTSNLPYTACRRPRSLDHPRGEHQMLATLFFIFCLPAARRRWPCTRKTPTTCSFAANRPC